MCGIVGALSLNAEKFRVSDSYLRPMRDAMEHRGPDGFGLWLEANGKVGFGHRRLSIIDLSDAAAQPMVSKDGQVVLTYNGEVYNHAEIRQELEEAGIKDWQSHSDTEVILKAYMHWGIDCLHKFRGMFALAIWDGKTEEMFLVRDRVGIKPLYYTKQQNRFIFASEIKALLNDSDIKREVNEEALFHFLSFITTPAPMTLFEGINKLEPGTYLKIDKNGNTEKIKWWDVLDADIEEIKTETAAAKQLMIELDTAVKYRKVSDVPVGVFLSGGIDSSTNTALFSEEGKLPVKTFSMGYDAEYESCKNEFIYAREVAEKFHAEHFEKALTIDEMLDFLPRMTWLQDEPIADPVCVPVYFVSKLAKDNGVTVCQVGEGADELFCGYPSWMAKLKLAKWNSLPVPNSLKKSLLWGLAKAGKTDTFYYESLLRATKKQPIFWGGVDVFTESHKQRLLNPRLREKFKNKSSYEVIEPIFNRYREKSKNFSWLGWMTYMDLNLRLPELLLMRVDKMSMGVSLEGRVPFLDHKFVEFAFHLPEKIKIKGGILKSILKTAVRGLIPDNIIDRKKQGFGMPVYEWYFEKLGDQTKIILEDFCNKTDFFDKEEVFKLVDSGKGSHVWYILNFALWWKHYIEPKNNKDIQTVKEAA
jgi:asparagine synthase (glutamine-hydrolysing)